MESKKHPLLKPDEVHIWSACFSENKSKSAYFLSLLSQDEKERASEFRFFRDQQKYTISRGILRHLLGEYLGETPQKVEILYGLWGKPCLPKEKALSFNLSHSGDTVLYALTQYYEVGIDVERIDKTLGLEDMARSIFSIKELSHWHALPSEEKVSVFFKCWVSKEAFLKASGKGWLENKEVFTLAKTNDFQQQKRNDLLKNGKMACPCYFEFIPGYASALFVDGPPLTPLHYTWRKDFSSRTFLGGECLLNLANHS